MNTSPNPSKICAWHDTPTGYGHLSKLFHWSMAVLMFGMLVSGIMLEDIPAQNRLAVILLHKSFGITVLALTAVRLVWRAVQKFPAPAAFAPKWEELAARLVHFALYALLLGMPLVGWAMSSAAGYPVSVFGLFSLPALVEKSDALKELFSDLHEIGGNIAIALIAVHTVAALFHHYIRKDQTLMRMMPFTKGD